MLRRAGGWAADHWRTNRTSLRGLSNSMADEKSHSRQGVRRTDRLRRRKHRHRHAVAVRGRTSGENLQETGGAADQGADLPGVVVGAVDAEDQSAAPGAERRSDLMHDEGNP